MAIIKETNMDESIYNGIDLQYRHMVLNLDNDVKKDTPSLQPKEEKKSNSSFDEISQYAAPVKGFVDTSQIVVPRHDGKFVKIETIKAIADGIKRACIPRMIADISRCGLYPEEKMQFVWKTHWDPSRFAVLALRVGAMTPNPKFRANGLLPTLPTLCMRILVGLNGLMHEVFVKAYYNGKIGADKVPMVEVAPVEVDEYLEAVPIQLTQYEVSAIGEGFFEAFKEAYKQS